MDHEGQIKGIKLIAPFKMDLKDKQVDILIALTDNEGYAEYELADMIGSYATYTNDLLKELSNDNFGDLIDSYTIQLFHLKDPLSLHHKLEDQRDLVSKYIYKNMPSMFKENLPGSDVGTIGFFLALGLDGFLIDEDLYSKERFSNVKMSKNATKLIALKENLKQGNIRILNRILIEDTYPDEITKSRFSLIHKKIRVEPNKSKEPYFINPDLRTFYFIIEYLEHEINSDKSRLDEMTTRLKRDMRGKGYSGFEDLFIERSEQEKGIKVGKYDMTYFRKRYDKNIDILMKFMTSNYVGELMKKYGYKEILSKAMPIEKFDYEKVIEMSVKNGYISEEEEKELKKEYIKKLEAKRTKSQQGSVPN